MRRAFMVIIMLVSLFGSVNAADYSALMELYNAGKALEAFPQVEKSLLSDPNSSELHDLAGRCLYTMERYKEAISHHEAVLQDSIAPLWRIAWANVYLGLSNYGIGNYVEAETYLNQAIRMNATKNATDTAKSSLERLGLSAFFGNWLIVETEAIRFHFQTPTVVLDINGYVSQHTKAYQAIYDFFKPVLPKKIDYYVWNSPYDPEMQRISGHTSLGFANPQLSYVWAHSEQSKGHELTHVLSYWSEKPTERIRTAFINEGIGVAFDQKSTDRLQLARTAISRYRIDAIDIKALWNNPSVRSAMTEDELYPIAGYFIEQLIDIGGRERFLKLVANQTYDHAVELYGDDLAWIISAVEKNLNSRSLLQNRLDPTKPAIYLSYDQKPSQGNFTFDVEVLPAIRNGKVNSIAVEIDGKQVYLNDEPSTKNPVMVDTMKFADGLHQMVVTWVDQNQEAYKATSTFSINNWSEMVDAFRRPVENAFWGIMDFSTVEKASDGWAFATAPVTVFGDDGRKISINGRHEYLIWKAANLSSFAVTLYVKTSEIDRLPELIDISTSPTSDDDTWQQIPFDTQDKGERENGWAKVVISGKVPDAMNWLKLTLKETAKPEVIQVGDVGLVYRNW